MLFIVKTCLPQRYIFAIMGFVASIITYMLQATVVLTMSHMVNGTISSPLVQYDPHSCPTQVNQSIDPSPEVHETKGPYNWDASTQAKIISSYRTSYIMTQFLGGTFADIKGGKNIFGVSMLMSSMATILIPLTAMLFNSNGVIVLRFIAGLAGGTIIPTQLSMMSKWVPANERAFVASIIFPGVLFGRLAAPYVANYLMMIVGWQSVYYVFGIIGLIWVAVWKYTCYSNPNEHPNICVSEKAYLNSTTVSVIRTTKYDLDPLPWKAYLRCVPFWTCVVGYTGREWAFSMLTTQVPQYLRDVLRFDATGTHLEYLPYLGFWIFTLLFGFISDVVVVRGYCSLLFIRRFATSIGVFISSLCIIIITYSGCNAVISTYFMFIGILVLGAAYSGVMINMLDMNPNYAGAMIGVVDNIAINSVVVLSSLQSLIVPDALLSHWHIYVWIVFFIIIFTLVICVYYMTTEQMWWDDVRQYGYPANWKHGRFSTQAEIDENGKTVIKLENDNIEIRL